MQLLCSTPFLCTQEDGADRYGTPNTLTVHQFKGHLQFFWAQTIPFLFLRRFISLLTPLGFFLLFSLFLGGK